MAGYTTNIDEQIQRWLLEDAEDGDVLSECEDEVELSEQNVPPASPHKSDIRNHYGRGCQISICL